MTTIALPSRARSFTRHIPTGLALFASFIFLQSLVFKFTGAPETVYIFETKLDAWAASLGFAGVFAPGGLFSAKVVGSVEAVAALLMIAGSLIASQRRLQVLGAAIGLAVISGAIFFHLFTPLGIAVQNADGSLDGGALFSTAVAVWLALAIVLYARRDLIKTFIRR